MNKILPVIFLFSFISFGLHSQVDINVGFNAGGAIPSESVESSSASILPGAYLGFTKDIKLGEKIYLAPEISFEFKHFGYSSIQKKDTVVVSQVAGIMANIPTYYTANVTGKSRFITLNADIPFGISIGKKAAVLFGVYGNYKLYKSDQINVHVQIGEGGLIPDVDSSNNNAEQINNFEGGLMLGGKYSINENLSLNFNVYRALSRHYVYGTIPNDSGQDIPFYFTMFRVGVKWLINS
ncbi:MAG: outer membrane beta-barrel protein [Bacteroidales bacterium]|nr:outer membrane beta-barrel protein [Bacteroidales bacterium]